MKQIIIAVRNFISERFNLHADKANEKSIVEAISRDVQFKGTNLWTLIFAIFIASIGLNVNSTAVVIGAMLISPLMGPIMGIGLAIAINDFELLQRGAKNLGIAAVFSIATSAFYFSLTPLQDVGSELLARTTPSVWDVFIAFFGGLAGIVAGTRKQKTNVIPGVAIATALMPPLCTAGYGLATGQWFYFLGALYLFFINGLFICIATFLIVKHLKFRRKEFASPESEKRVSRYMLAIVIVTILPSVYMAYRIVQRSIFENNARKFVQQEFHYTRTQVVTHKYNFDGSNSSIELLLVGQPLEPYTIDSLKKVMPSYKLGNVKLIIHQGLDPGHKVDFSAVKASVLEEVFAAKLSADAKASGIKGVDIPELKGELKVLYPGLQDYALGHTVFQHTDTTRSDTLTLFVGKFKKGLPYSDRRKLARWLKERIGADSVKVVVE